jgi:hypothetical protein
MNGQRDLSALHVQTIFLKALVGNERGVVRGILPLTITNSETSRRGE